MGERGETVRAGAGAVRRLRPAPRTNAGRITAKWTKSIYIVAAFTRETVADLSQLSSADFDTNVDSFHQ